MSMAEYDEWLWDEYKKFAHVPGRRRDKSQAEFARWLGLSPPNISRYLNGDVKPDYATCMKMAEKLGNEAYIKAGFPSPSQEPGQATFTDVLDSMPQDRIPAFFASIREISEIAKDTGIDVDSPEGFEMVKKVFDKYGL